jgi:hypothetical protein
MAAEPGSAGQNRRRGPGRRTPPRTPGRSLCIGHGRIRSKGCRTRDSRGVPLRRSPARAARRPPEPRASLRGALRRPFRAASSPVGAARSGANSQCRRAGGLWTASATQSARRPWAHRDMDGMSVRPYTSAATRPMRATLTRAPCSTAASIRAMSRSEGLRRTLLRAPNISDTASTGISSGNPPACHTPRFTSATRSGKCVWHWLRSLHELRIAITGRPSASAAE